MKITNNPNEPQRITLDIVFKERHTPFNESHTIALLKNYFKGKGINFDPETATIYV